MLIKRRSLVFTEGLQIFNFLFNSTLVMVMYVCQRSAWAGFGPIFSHDIRDRLDPSLKFYCRLGLGSDQGEPNLFFPCEVWTDFIHPYFHGLLSRCDQVYSKIIKIWLDPTYFPKNEFVFKSLLFCN